MRRGVWLALALCVAAGCDRGGDGDLRQAYERMMASAERRAADQARRVQEAPAPVAVQPETVPAASDTAAAPFEGTAGIEQREQPGIEPATLRDVRSGEHAGFDRIVFEFDGPDMPGYHLEYIDRPVRECGSGHVVPIAGDGWLRVRFEPARAHEFIGESARATVTNRNRTVDHAVLRQLTLTCDFEAQVEWVLGVGSPNRYRALELSEPSRLVVDILH